jgi:quinoprotein glucose dehydrogenase
MPSLIPWATLAFGALLCSGLPAVFAAENSSDGGTTRGQLEAQERLLEPVIDPASDEATLALTRMKLPPGFQATLWAAEPMLANPVSFNLDEQGRVFVTETHRYGSSVLDIRGYMWMLEDDLATRNQDDFLASIRRNFGDAGMAELSRESERLVVLEDTNGDGAADTSSVYADNFRSPIDGVASGVLIRRNEVWFTNIPALWKFTGRDQATTRTELLRGFGIRFNYTGHDLHGLIFGPDGRIYFSIGDRAASVKTKEGTVLNAQDTGSVFRCWPDGTGLELFATGLRNPQSLAFNEYGDLFTGDNDSDQGDQERLVHLVENGDSGWRIGYQFAPRENAGPWNAEKLWWPRHAQQPAYLLPPICNIEDGPSGIAFHPGTGMVPGYDGQLFITHFKGAITHSGIYAYRLKPAGASYAIDTAAPFLQGALPTDVRFGPDGKLYYSDWAEGWPKSRRGRIYALFDPARAKDPLTKQTQQLIASDWTKKSIAELANLLAHADWRVRLEAQYSLAAMDGAGLLAFAGELTGTSALARRHSVWGLGQLARKHASAVSTLRGLLDDADAEIRAQAARTLGDLRDSDSAGALVAALKDSSPRVQFFAAEALGKIKHVDAAPALFAAIQLNNDADHYLRHALVMGLVGCATPEQLLATTTDNSRAVRIAALLALRRLADAKAAAFLADPDPLIVREAAEAINDAPIPAAYPALAAFLQKPVADEPLILRALNAHFRLGAAENATALADFAARTDGSETLRKEALSLLTLWPAPPARDRIVGVFRPLAEKTRDAAVAADALAPHFGGLLAVSNPESVAAAAIDAVVTLKLVAVAPTLHAVVRNAAQRPEIRAAALRSLDAFGDPRLSEAVAAGLAADAAEVRLAALPLSSRLHPESAVTTLAKLLEGGTPAEQRAAFAALGTATDPRADEVIFSQLNRLAAGQVAPSAQLELLEAAALRSDPRIKAVLANREATLAKDPNPIAPFRAALEGGNGRNGARLFSRHPVITCSRCHRNSDSPGGEAGPQLAGIGARESREYILESILKPSAKIAEGFAIATVTRKSGEAIVGTIAFQDENLVRLQVGEGAPLEIPRTDIKSVELAPSAMPEVAALVLTKAEIRDLVEFVANLKQPARPRDQWPIRALLSQPAD